MDIPSTLKLIGLVPHPDSPFKRDVEQFQKAMKESNRSHQMEGYQKRKITIIEETTYFPGAFTKLYKNKELLDDLSPEACKILVHIALNLPYEEEKIEIRYADIYMERRKSARGMRDLIGKRIIAKDKGQWYWVNITLLIVGNINKHNTQ